MASQPGRADGAPQYPLLGTSGTHQSIPEESDDEERDTPQGNVWLNQESVVSYQCPHRVLRQGLDVNPPPSAYALDPALKQALDAYIQKWGPLLVMDMNEEKRMLKDRLENWSEDRLMADGFMLQGLTASKDPRLAGGRHTYTLHYNNNQRLPFHRFTSGTQVTLTQGHPLHHTSYEAYVVGGSPYDIRIAIQKKSLHEGPWRLDVSIGLEMYTRAAAALRSLYTPLSATYASALFGRPHSQPIAAQHTAQHAQHSGSAMAHAAHSDQQGPAASPSPLQAPDAQSEQGDGCGMHGGQHEPLHARGQGQQGGVAGSDVCSSEGSAGPDPENGGGFIGESNSAAHGLRFPANDNSTYRETVTPPPPPPLPPPPAPPPPKTNQEAARDLAAALAAFSRPASAQVLGAAPFQGTAAAALPPLQAAQPSAASQDGAAWASARPPLAPGARDKAGWASQHPPLLSQKHMQPQQPQQPQLLGSVSQFGLTVPAGGLQSAVPLRPAAQAGFTAAQLPQPLIQQPSQPSLLRAAQPEAQPWPATAAAQPAKPAVDLSALLKMPGPKEAPKRCSKCFKEGHTAQECSTQTATQSLGVSHTPGLSLGTDTSQQGTNKRPWEGGALGMPAVKQSRKDDGDLPAGTVLAPFFIAPAVAKDGRKSVDVLTGTWPPAMPVTALAWAAERSGSAAAGAGGAVHAAAGVGEGDGGVVGVDGADVAAARVSSSRAALEDERLGLNQSQMAAVAMAMRNPVSVIQGPPGTGKTSTTVRFLALLVQQLGYRRGPILACAQSNVAVDNLLQGLCDRGIYALRVGQSGKARPDQRDSQVFYTPKVLRGAQVICSTLVGAGSEMLDSMVFPLVVIDEGSQATEPECLIPICKGAEHVVFVGDHHQLPPVVKSDRAAQGGLSVSLMERLMHQGVPSALLQVQYRMHPGLSRFPSDMFYAGRLVDGVTGGQRPRPHGLPWPSQHAPMMFIDVRGNEVTNQSGSKSNQTEVQVCHQVVAALLAAGVQPKDIGVVAPYVAQVRLLENRLRDFMPARRYPGSFDPSQTDNDSQDANGIEIKSVDGYQGREKDVIVLSAVRSNTQGQVGFLDDWRRLNVAITRAKSGLVIVGNADTLRAGDKTWAALVQHCERLGCVVPAHSFHHMLTTAARPRSSRWGPTHAEAAAQMPSVQPDRHWNGQPGNAYAQAMTEAPTPPLPPATTSTHSDRPVPTWQAHAGYAPGSHDASEAAPESTYPPPPAATADAYAHSVPPAGAWQAPAGHYAAWQAAAGQDGAWQGGVQQGMHEGSIPPPPANWGHTDALPATYEGAQQGYDPTTVAYNTEQHTHAAYAGAYTAQAAHGGPHWSGAAEQGAWGTAYDAGGVEPGTGQ